LLLKDIVLINPDQLFCFGYMNNFDRGSAVAVPFVNK
jgi:hypothetical protein